MVVVDVMTMMESEGWGVFQQSGRNGIKVYQYKSKVLHGVKHSTTGFQARSRFGGGAGPSH